MSAQNLLTLLADEDGNLSLEDAVAALSNAVNEAVESGKTLTGQQTLYLFSLQLDYVTGLLAELIVQTQNGLVAAQQGIDTLLTGQRSTIPDYKMGEELQVLLLGVEVERLARMYDMLTGGADDTDQSEAGDDQREADPAT